MRVLGIDPGTLHLGWGVLQVSGNCVQHVAHGVVDLSAKLALPARLTQIERALDQLVEQHSPTIGSVESLFFHRDPQAAAKLGHARGVVLLTLARAGLPIFEYPPARVKLTVAGNGQAEKIQVAAMIRTVLGLSALPRSDAADALAIALTHVRRAPVDALLARAQAERNAVRAGNGAAVNRGSKGQSAKRAGGDAKARLLALVAAAKA